MSWRKRKRGSREGKKGKKAQESVVGSLREEGSRRHLSRGMTCSYVLMGILLLCLE